ncbi:putative amino acid permease YhdG [Planctomycetes bacterium Pan216]|uniref:Putative amino acid permease YhdG n=1 Tax=Kolteria novifilia TaxID=2527975 RepID=A0A518B7M8_9BACT|nr:putative amino acid permease YhdG [Planctomycetes bacterium Pan216]
MTATRDESTTLNRTLGLPMVTIYGLGTIVGGGFYALTGKVAATAGMLTPLAFLVAAVIALLSAFSFAELSARFPYSAGEAHYVREAFGLQWLSALVGWMVIATGVVSAATLANALAEFMQEFAIVPKWPIIAVSVVALGLITAWGIKASASLALVITLIEIGGLLLVLLLGSPRLGELPTRWREFIPADVTVGSLGVLFGAYLAFYSFIGFEDMVNVAEEVKEPEHNLPSAILISVLATSLLYVLISLVVVLSATTAELAESPSPLALVFGDWRLGADSITIIGMLAGVNGALVQIVMASRVVFGLSQKHCAPRIFGRVHPWTRTPLESTFAITVTVLILALWFPLVPLAKMTSTILLIIFALINAALWRLKGTTPHPGGRVPSYPRWLPLSGCAACVGILLVRLGSLL